MLADAELAGIEPLLSQAPGISERQSGLDRRAGASRDVIVAGLCPAGEVKDRDRIMTIAGYAE